MFYRNYVHRNNAFGAGLLAFIAGAVAWAIFGNRVKDKVRESQEFQELKSQVMEKANEISDLTREKYDLIVDEVAHRYSKAKSISQNEMMDLIEDLKMHWSRMRKAWKDN